MLKLRQNYIDRTSLRSFFVEYRIRSTSAYFIQQSHLLQNWSCIITYQQVPLHLLYSLIILLTEIWRALYLVNYCTGVRNQPVQVLGICTSTRITIVWNKVTKKTWNQVFFYLTPIIFKNDWWLSVVYSEHTGCPPIVCKLWDKIRHLFKHTR